MSPLMVDFTPLRCGWCGVSGDDERVMACPSCGALTCYACVYLFADALACKHTTPCERHVLTTQDWTNDDTSHTG